MEIQLPLKLTIDDDLSLKSIALGEETELFKLTDTNRTRLREWLPWLDHTTSVDDSQKFIESKAKATEGLEMGIWYQNKFAGMIGIHGVSQSNQSLEIGYWLGEEFAKKGIMTRATKELIKFAFDSLKFNRIAIRCATENINSRAIPERLGLTHEGTLRQAEWLYDHFVDLEVYSILAEEYRSGRLK